MRRGTDSQTPGTNGRGHNTFRLAMLMRNVTTKVWASTGCDQSAQQCATVRADVERGVLIIAACSQITARRQCKLVKLPIMPNAAHCLAARARRIMDVICIVRVDVTASAGCQWPTASIHSDREYAYIFTVSLCLQCFDAVGWAAGRASGL